MKKPIVVFLIPTILSITPAMAIDFSKFEATCLEIGFKRNTETFGDCVLELASRAKKANAQKAQLQAQEQQREYERQKQREIAALRQQQEQQAWQQQQQQLAAAKRQQESRENVDMFIGVMGILGGAASGYAERRRPVQTYQPPQSYHCRSTSSMIGNYVNTDTNCR
jgi:hypothetical protein